MAATSLRGHTFPFLEDFSVSQRPHPPKRLRNSSSLAVFVLLSPGTAAPHKQQSRRLNRQDKYFGSSSGIRAHRWHNPTAFSLSIFG